MRRPWPSAWAYSSTCKVRGQIDKQVNSWNSHYFGLAAHLSASNFPGAALHIVRTQDTAHIFTAKRPASGEEVTVTIAPSGMGCLITFQGTPPHDVTDLVRAYQRTPSSTLK